MSKSFPLMAMKAAALTVCFLWPLTTAGDEKKDGKMVVISIAEKEIKLDRGTGPFGANCKLELSYDKGIHPATTATIVFEVYQHKDKKDVHVFTVFHKIELKDQKGKAKVHFLPVNITLNKDAEMRLYLVETINPEPKPQRAMSLVAGAEVYTVEKTIKDMKEVKELKGFDVKPISEVLKVPVKAP